MAKHEKPYTSTEQAMDQAVKVVRDHLAMIPSLKIPEWVEQRLADAARNDYLNIVLDRGWGISCGLNISLRHGGLEREETRMVLHKTARVEVSWSSTGSEPAEAMAAIALYTQVAQLACLLESVLGRLDIADVEAIAPKAAAMTDADALDNNARIDAAK